MAVLCEGARKLIQTSEFIENVDTIVSITFMLEVLTNK